jgi:hypothetical protein
MLILSYYLIHAVSLTGHALLAIAKSKEKEGAVAVVTGAESDQLAVAELASAECKSQTFHMNSAGKN